MLCQSQIRVETFVIVYKAKVDVGTRNILALSPNFLIHIHIADPHEPSRRPHRGQHVRQGRPWRQTLLQGFRPPFRPLPALQPQHNAEPHQLQARNQVTMYRIAMDTNAMSSIIIGH